MFNEDELKVYDKKFQAIGILDKEEQKKMALIYNRTPKIKSIVDYN